MRWMLLLSLLMVTGCETTPSRTAAPGAGEGVDARPIAYIAGEPVTQREAAPLLYEAAGGPVLADLVLERELRRRLDERGLAVTDADVQAERQRLLETLADDPDQAARLLGEVRQQRGLGSQRFEQLLWRNAALRKLAADVRVEPVAVQREFAIVHGPKYQPRVIVADSAREAAQLRQRIIAGEDFAAVAAEASTDASATTGGLLPPISPEDPSYAEALREALPKLGVGQVSSVLSIDDRFGLVKLERKIPADAVEWADVEEALTARVRRRGEALAMQRLARSILTDTSVTVLDPTLQQSWARHRAGATQP